MQGPDDVIPTESGSGSIASASIRTRIVAWLGETEGLESEVAATRAAPALVSSIERVFLEGSGHRPRVGGRLGPYRLVDFVGRGGMSSVFAAVDERDGRRVALKVAPRSQTARYEALRNEAELLPRARHPNVVALRGAGEDDLWFWIALDLHEGESLASRLKVGPAIVGAGKGDSDDREAEATTSRSDPVSPQRRIPPRQAMTWFRDLAGALGALHGAGLIHRDVKPSNVVFDGDDRPVLIDFGLAKAVGDLEVESFLVGTLPYMSPEQTQAGFSALDRTSDLYSLAMSIHEALTGTRFALGRDRHEVIQRVAFSEVPPPSRLARGVPESLDPIFATALAKHPRDRYRSAGHLVEDLDRWLAGRPLKHAREPLRLRARRFARRHPVIAVLVLALFIGTPVGIGLAELRVAREVTSGLEESRDLLAAGRDLEALEAAGALLDRHPEDPRARDVYRRAAERAAPLLSRRMLADTAFTASFDPDDRPHRPHVARAERELTRAVHPDFLFQAAFGRHLEKRDAEALAFIDDHPQQVTASPLLRELRAYLLLVLERADAYVVARAATDADALQPEVIALRARRLFREARAGFLDGVLTPDPRDAARSRDRLDDLVALAPNDRLARSVRALLRLNEGDPEGALADLRALDAASEEPRSPALDAWLARALAEAARGADDERLADVRLHLDRAVAAHPRYLAWFADVVHVTDPGARDRVLRLVLEHEQAAVAGGSDRLWHRLLVAAKSHSDREAHRELIDLLAVADASTASPASPTARAHRDAAAEFGAWAWIHLTPDDLDAALTHPGEEAALARVLVRLDRRADGLPGWFDRVGVTIAAARLAALRGDVPGFTAAAGRAAGLVADDAAHRAETLAAAPEAGAARDAPARLAAVRALLERLRGIAAHPAPAAPGTPAPSSR